MSQNSFKFKPSDDLTPEEKTRFADIYGDDAAFQKRGSGYEHLQGDFKSTHFDQPNIIAHARMDDREIPVESLKDSHPELYARLKAEGRDTAKALHVSEYQSDWHKAARRLREREIKRLVEGGMSKEDATAKVSPDFGYKQDLTPEEEQRATDIKAEIVSAL